MKIRLQLQGELQAKGEAAKKYKGVLHGVKVILQNEGPKGLFRGIGSAVCVTSLAFPVGERTLNTTRINSKDLII